MRHGESLDSAESTNVFRTEIPIWRPCCVKEAGSLPTFKVKRRELGYCLAGKTSACLWLKRPFLASACGVVPRQSMSPLRLAIGTINRNQLLYKMQKPLLAFSMQLVEHNSAIHHCARRKFASRHDHCPKVRTWVGATMFNWSTIDVLANTWIHSRSIRCLFDVIINIEKQRNDSC